MSATSADKKYGLEERPDTVLSSNALEVKELVKNKPYSVFVGRNNCGKSFILKTLAQELGENAAYIGPARYTNFNSLTFYQPRNKKSEYQRFLSRWRRENHNLDNSPVNLQQSIAELDDEKRKTLFSLMNSLLGVEICIEKADPGNEMSQPYLSCNGHNFSFTSSGTRLVASILTCLLDSDFENILIDEPELGISPEAQGILSDFLFNSSERKKYFPHLKSLVFATHSSIFLDRKSPENNYLVSKEGDQIDISKTESIQELNRIHFLLLGNRMETLYLPTAILITEGKTDASFLRSVLRRKFPNSTISVVSAGDDSRVLQTVSLAGGLLMDLQKSPFRDRIIPVLDSVHANNLVGKLVKLGLPEDNIVVWSENGIEHYYPKGIMNDIFPGIGEIEISGDRVSKNGTSYSKSALSEKVCEALTDAAKFNPEFEAKIIQKIENIVG